VQQFPRTYWGLWRRALAIIVAACIAQVSYAGRLTAPFANGTGRFPTQSSLIALINSHAATFNWQGFSSRHNKIGRLFQQLAVSAIRELRQAIVVMCWRWGST
jgi:hypothetical protein